MADIRINQLPVENTPAGIDVLAIDGLTTRQATITKVVEAGRPAATQAEAEAGTDPTKVMTPLTTAQAIAFQGAAGFVPVTRTVNAGTGLAGGGALSSNVTLNLNPASIASLALADTVVQKLAIASNLSDLANVATARTNLGLAIGTNVQAFSTNLSTLAAVTPGATGLALLADATIADAWSYLSDTSAFDQTLTGHFWGPDGARFHKMTDRVLIDAAARDFDETNNENGSYVATEGGSGYIDRCTSFAAYSSRGGIGISGASRTSDQYTSFPDQYPGVVPTPWLPSGVATLGQRRAYQGRVYTVTVAGTFSTSPPVHQTPGGSATNGTATLQFIDYTYMTPAGAAFFAIQDSADTGTAAWAQYSEVVQKAAAGAAPSFIAEWNAKNQSAVNPINDPYNRFAACIGLGLAAGGDPNAGAPTNPSSNALLIYKNGHTWNTGIVFDATGITGTDGITGFGIAMKLARGHVVEWQYAGGNVGFDLVSTVDTATAKQTQSVDNTGTTWLNNSGIPLFKIAAIAGTVTGNLQTLAVTGGGRPLLQANGSAANMDIEYAPKGTGKNYSTAFWAGNADGSFGAKVQIRAGSGLSSMSFGWTGSAVTIYVDNTLVRTLAANT